MRAAAWLCCAILTIACHPSSERGREGSGEVLYVAPSGNDSWTGQRAAPNAAKTDGPVASLTRARDLIRERRRAGLPAGGITVEILEGDYQLREPLQLGPDDSGTAAAPITYLARGRVRLTGGVVLREAQRVDNSLQARLDPVAVSNVVEFDLRALGITDFGSAAGGGIELFFEGVPMPLARWPDEGFMTIAGLAGGAPIESHGLHGDRVGKLIYSGDRPSRWVDEPDAWLHGYWFWDWSDDRQRIASIDVDRKVISLAEPYHHYGFRSGQWFYAYNVLRELDRPGEWYVDRASGKLLFWPPRKGGTAVISVTQQLLALHDASYISIIGATFEAGRRNAIEIDGGSHIAIRSCNIRNVGGWAIRIVRGTTIGVSGCTIRDTGQGGIYLEAGDRESLTGADDRIENNEIERIARWNRTFQPAIALVGVGHRVAHNLIHDVPHMAINFSGNDHLIELNEIYHTCTETNDAGAVYAGRDWTMRGTVIRQNYLHDISGFRNQGCAGIYLDDMLSGIEVTGNLFYKVTRAVFVGGGRDNEITNNIFAHCDPAIHVDGRALGWAAPAIQGVMRERLSAVPYRDVRWSKRYPKLVNILEDSPAAPKGNVIARNIVWESRWDEIDDDVRPLLDLTDNFVSGDPHFVDPTHLNFRLTPDAPALAHGFKAIPIDEIGPQR